MIVLTSKALCLMTTSIFLKPDPKSNRLLAWFQEAPAGDIAKSHTPCSTRIKDAHATINRNVNLRLTPCVHLTEQMDVRGDHC